MFEQNKSIERFGERFGYIFSYFLFTTILFLMLSWLNKVPEDWSYLHIMVVVILVVLIGTIIKRLLK